MARWAPWVSDDSPTLPWGRYAPHLSPQVTRHHVHISPSPHRRFSLSPTGRLCSSVSPCQYQPYPSSRSASMYPQCNSCRKAGKHAPPCLSLYSPAFKVTQPRTGTTAGGFSLDSSFWVSCIDPWSYTMGGVLNSAPQRCPCPNPGTSRYVMLGGRRNFADVMKGPELGRSSWWGPCSRRRAGVRSENGSRGRSDGGRGPARAGRHLQEEPRPTLNRF